MSSQSCKHSSLKRRRSSRPACSTDDAAQDSSWPQQLAGRSTSVSYGAAIAQASQWLQQHRYAYLIAVCTSNNASWLTCVSCFRLTISALSVIDPKDSAAELLAKASGFRGAREMLQAHSKNSIAALSAEQWAQFKQLCNLRAQHMPVQVTRLDAILVLLCVLTSLFVAWHYTNKLPARTVVEHSSRACICAHTLHRI
jgi:hypothetical protein